MGMILSGWKEIASYLHCGVRTVQRWEVDGLPIYRPALVSVATSSLTPKS